MKEYRFEFNLSDIDKISLQFLELTKDVRQFAFYGAMGAGKTTFIKALCQQLGTTDLVSSPTFSIVNEYLTAEGIPVFHFDFYRIKEQSELLDIGFDEYCQKDGYCFIEWPEKGENVIPEYFLNVFLEEIEEEKRALSFSI
jgi:tRNA threonylcarbamoyladenosine biosynthesis protein TsaE